MTKAATVHVPNGILMWGRKRAEADIFVAAARCGHDVADLEAWEANESDPPLSALRELAEYYQLPLAAFLLSKPKDEPKPTVDQRKFAGVEHPVTNRQLALALNRAAGLQVVAFDLLEGLDASPFRVVANDLDPEWLAVEERAALGVTVDDQLGWTDQYEALREWRAAMERRGAFVMQTPLSDGDVRAFSLRADPPVIVLDRADWFEHASSASPTSGVMSSSESQASASPARLTRPASRRTATTSLTPSSFQQERSAPMTTQS